jgi:hypothetical protein
MVQAQGAGVICDRLYIGDFIGRHFYHPAGGFLKRQKFCTIKSLM